MGLLFRLLNRARTHLVASRASFESTTLQLQKRSVFRLRSQPREPMEPMAFCRRGIDAGADYWHACSTLLPGAVMAITAREIDRDPNLATGVAARLACRRGTLRGTTAGVAPGYVQGNLAVLPKDLAADFLRFCQANPKPCPVIGVSDVGNPRVPALGLDLDIRTDLPGYRVWRDGELA